MARPGGNRAAERARDFRPGRERPLTRNGRPRVGERAAAGVDDDDPPSRLREVARGERLERRPVRVHPALERVLGERPCGERVALDLGRQVAPLAALELEAERHLEREQHHDRERDVARNEPPAHSGGRNRKPTPRTV